MKPKIAVVEDNIDNRLLVQALLDEMYEISEYENGMEVVEGLADEFAGRARFVRVDMDRDGTVAAAFKSSGVPDYLVFKDGVEVDRVWLVAVTWMLESRLRWMVKGAID